MRLSNIAVLVLILTLLTSFTHANDVLDNSKSTTYLFVLSGSSGSLDGDKLTLNGVSNVVYFSDRPARIAGHMSNVAFLDKWHKGASNFDSDPPNATLSILDDESSNSVVELMNPELNKDGSLSFQIKVLRGEVPKSFKAASLFVDLYGIDTAATAE